jgi:hypothetical protein
MRQVFGQFLDTRPSHYSSDYSMRYFRNFGTNAVLTPTVNFDTSKPGNVLNGIKQTKERKKLMKMLFKK